MEEVKDFYSTLKFPGLYNLQDLEFYDHELNNKYLRIFDDAIAGARSVIDVGCGSGFIVNFLARRHPGVEFDAVDFSDAIDYSKQFSKNNNIDNITYFKTDFLEWAPEKKYDVVICNGVIHHIPEYETAIEKIKTLTDKKLVLGVYNAYGKILKNYVPVRYANDILYHDQENCPFEVSFTNAEFLSRFTEYRTIKTHPGYKNHFVDLYNLFNSSNGGLTVYVFNLERPKQIRCSP